MSLSFEYEGINLEYEIIGNGEKAMFAFHGFSSSSSMFGVLEPSLGKNYTIYSFNLPYHGKSTIDAETTIHGIDTLQLQKYFKSFLWHIHHSYFSLLGYSIGGKLALKLIELFPNEVQHIFLFAPAISLFKNSMKTEELTPPSRTINLISPRDEIAEIKEKYF